MSITGILLAGACVGGTGLLLGLFLGVADKKFKVEVDEKELRIRELLPGNNCGGCGYAGCDALAKAIASGEASVNACPVGGEPAADKIAGIMGREAGKTRRKVAFVKCAGDCGKTKKNYEYYGAQDCGMLAFVPSGGPKSCKDGCLGFGTCAKACPFGAIYIRNGIAVVDREACKACGKCISHCPKQLIEMVPYDLDHLVQCSGGEHKKHTADVCKAGCIGCGKCERDCPVEAITVVGHMAHVDTEKCVNCGLCALVCPRKVITNIPQKK